MDPLVSAAIANQQAATLSKIQYAVAGKLLDSQKQQGAAAIQLIQAATRGTVKAGDQLAAAATGLGGSLDVHA